MAQREGPGLGLSQVCVWSLYYQGRGHLEKFPLKKVGAPSTRGAELQGPWLESVAQRGELKSG